MKKLYFYFFLLIINLQNFGQVGNFLWMAPFYGNSLCVGQSVAVDPSGNVYSTGVFKGTNDFDPGPSVYNLTTPANFDTYICKLGPGGNFIWAKRFTGSLDKRSFHMVLDAISNIYITGDFQGTVDFDPGTGVFNLTATTNHDIFVSKLDMNGNFIWAKQFTGSTAGSYNTGNKVILDGSGNVVVTGYFQGTVDFDPGVPTYTMSTIFGTNQDIFVCKLDGNGNFIWAKKAGGVWGGDVGQGMSIDPSDNIIVTGAFGNTVDFDPGPAIFNLTAPSGWNAYVWKLDPAGNFLWAKQIGSGASAVIAWGAAVDAGGNIYSTGNFNGAGDFDPGPSTFSLVSISSDQYVSKLDPGGNFIWAKNMGGYGAYVDGRDLSTDISGDLLITGYFKDTVDFDPNVGTFTITSAPDVAAIFICKLTSSGNFSYAGRLGRASSIGNSIVSDPQKNIYITGYFSGSNCDFDPGPGTYTVTATGNDPFVYKMGPCPNPSAPTDVTPGTKKIICAGQQTTLNAVGSGTIVWFSSSISTTVLGTGNNYITPTLTAGNYTYYVESDTCLNSLTRTPITITVNPLPIVSPTSPGTVCPYSNVCFGANAASTYTWAGPCGFVSNIQNPCIFNMLPFCGCTFTVWISDANACINNATTCVNFYPSPTVTAVSSTSLLCTGQTATLTGNGAVSYNWNPGGAGTSVVISPTTNTSYTLTGTNSFGCNDSISIIQNVSSCVDIKQIEKVDIDFTIYPNPFHYTISILAGSGSKLTIYNAIGELIYNDELKEEKTEFDLSNQPNGVYFIKIVNEIYSFVKKVIKMD